MIKNKEVSMKIHPRAFAAFGSDLVTNDNVAVTELVKNSYDAFANNASVVFGSDSQSGKYIEIVDDGIGMTQEVVQTAWTLIATPYKKNHPFVEKNGKRRMVSGNKGLGRFSAARLGKKMRILTYNQKDECFSATINWEDFSRAETIDECKVILEEYDKEKFIKNLSNYFNKETNSGTIIKIYELNTEWTDRKLEELESSLSRLLSPFENVDDFSLSLFQKEKELIVKIEPHEFIKNPVYSIRGNVDNFGSVLWTYIYAPRGVEFNKKSGEISWQEASQGFGKMNNAFKEDQVKPYTCGPFNFEIRAWDLDSESVGDIRDVFNVQRKEIRTTISQYKGISVYRDNVLVLPKSDSSKDWLGIDVRRISAIGKRLSTSQMIGILSITQKNNPELKDTTDREKLVDTPEYKQFCKVTESIISVLENNRNIDRKENVPVKNSTLTDLLTPLSPSVLESKIELMVKGGSNKEEILDTIREYNADTEKNLNELNDRLIYYAQAASLGSISLVIMHEIRSGMTVIKRFLNKIRKKAEEWDSKSVEYFEDAETSHKRLLDVADSFAPLYRKNLPKEKNRANILDAAEKSVRLISAKKEAKKVNFNIDIDSTYETAMHTGELQTIFVNLMDNSCYWLKNNFGDKIVNIKLRKLNEKKAEISVSDNGPGILYEEKDKIFNPGITGKPNGIGMGLVIITEILNNHKETVRLELPGELDGATFVFTLTLL